MIQTGISQEEATQLTRAMLQHRFQERHLLQAQNMLMETIQSGLPVEPVMNKAFEGMAKNKPDGLIVQAMKKTQSRYAYAYRNAQELTPDQEMQHSIGLSIAQGMGAGLQDKDMEPVMAQLHTRIRQMSQNKADELCLQTFLTARVMARLGVHPDKVSQVVCQALQNQFTAREMQQLRSNFNSRSQQMSPNQLANQYAQKLAQGEKPGESGSWNENSTGQSGFSEGRTSEPGNTSESRGGSENGSGNTGSGGSGGSDGSKGSGANGGAGGSGKK
jgi:uncharacterized protein (DUF2267 family)